jgi:hypothetical protein
MATRLAITAKVRTDEIAGAMRSIIWDALKTELALTLCRVGAIELMVSPDRFADLVPGVFVRPGGATYVSAENSGQNFQVTEEFRVAYAVPIAAQEDPGAKARAGIARIVAVLAADAGLSEIADSFAPDQLEDGAPAATEYDPAEDAFLEVDVPIKVVVCRWLVRWRTC